jgi:suppressor of fused
MAPAEGDDDGDTRGWDALTTALETVYGNVEPLHWGTTIPYALGGEDPLWGVSVYESVAGRPHWHYVSYGFSDLFGKESEDPDVSGFGFELTFRVARTSADEQAPIWPVNMLQNLARYVFNTGNAFGAGHHLNANGPICLGSDTALRAVAFAPDQGLPQVDSPFGRCDLMQMVGLTLDELQAIELWNCESFLNLARERDPQLITDLARGSWLADADFGRRVADGTERDGSSCVSLFNARFRFAPAASGWQVSLGAKEVEPLVRLLPGRLLHGNPLRLVGTDHVVCFEPSDARREQVAADQLTLGISADDVAEITSALKPLAGTYSAAGLSWLVEKSVVRDAEGNVMSEVG